MLKNEIVVKIENVIKDYLGFEGGILLWNLENYLGFDFEGLRVEVEIKGISVCMKVYDLYDDVIREGYVEMRDVCEEVRDMVLSKKDIESILEGVLELSVKYEEVDVFYKGDKGCKIFIISGDGFKLFLDGKSNDSKFRVNCYDSDSKERIYCGFVKKVENEVVFE